MKEREFIKAQEVNLMNLFSKSNDAYRVPIFQRPYAWGKDQWEELFEDIMGLEPEEAHFLGSIVVVPEGPHQLGVNFFEVVDGQQRLATLLIWLAVIRDIAKNKSIADKINDDFLFIKDFKGKKIPKLELNKLDNEVFIKILNGRSESINRKHLILECYKFFKQKTKNEEIYTKLLNNVYIVHINAISHYNAFKLFETLNDRGLELSAADLIKNFVLSIVSKDEELFNETIDNWNEMYDKVRGNQPVKFIRRYILSNYKGKISEKNLYKDVTSKLLKDKAPQEICNFVKDLNSASDTYKRILECSFPSDRINKKLKELHLIEVSPSFTLLLKILPFFVNKEIFEEDVLEIMEMIEIFHIRWGICNQATSRLDSIYNEICMELRNKNSIEFKSIIKQKFSQEIKNNVNNIAFKDNFISRDFKPNQSRTKYILWKLSEPTDETILNIDNIQTEHILPQKLNDKWIQYLKSKGYTEDKIEILHKEHLNKIGNLTIIKEEWNLKMSNRLFNEKKEDYRNSEFKITKELINYDEWTFEEIEKRTSKLAEKALDIWKWEE